MPEPNRPPWLVAPGMAGVTIARLIEREVALGVFCHACPHWVRWSPEELTRRFCRWPNLTVGGLAPHLYCGRCNSTWIEVGRADPVPTSRT